MLTKDADGSVNIVKTEDSLAESTMGGTVVGGLIGLFGGPAGVAIGAASGMALGATADVARAHLGRDFIAEVTRALAPGRIALVAEVDEESTEPLDERMKALDGQMFRRDLQDVADSDYEHSVAAVKSRIAQTKADVPETPRRAQKGCEHSERVSQPGRKMIADFFDLPPGVLAAVLLMLWPAIWAGALIIFALCGDLMRQQKRPAPHPMHKAA